MRRRWHCDSILNRKCRKISRRATLVKKNFNYNYAFLFYDANEKRVQKIFKVFKKYLSHFQYSVFRGSITLSQLILLR